MTDRKTLLYSIKLRKLIAERNNQTFVDLTYETVGDVIAMLEKQENASQWDPDCEGCNADDRAACQLCRVR